MKSIAFLLIMIGFCTFVNAQDTVYLKKEAKKKTFTDRPPQACYLELGGAGVALSANYDRRFNKQTDGLGFRAGIGYSFTTDLVKFTTLPVGLNYLAGSTHKGRFFEAGINGTLIFATSNDGGSIYNAQTITGRQTLFLTSFNFGYRSQPTTGGFNFRAGMMPFILEGITSVGGYLSCGYNF